MGCLIFVQSLTALSWHPVALGVLLLVGNLLLRNKCAVAKEHLTLTKALRKIDMASILPGGSYSVRQRPAAGYVAGIAHQYSALEIAALIIFYHQQKTPVVINRGFFNPHRIGLNLTDYNSTLVHSKLRSGKIHS